MAIIKRCLFFLVFISFSSLAAKNDGNIESKIDEVLDNQKEMFSVLDNNPLGTRTRGIELNLFRLLAVSNDWATLSGTYSKFDHNKNVEIAFPFYLSREREFIGDQATFVLTLDVHYRKFLGQAVNGFYLSGFTRAAYINGPVYDNNRFSSALTKNASTTKLGVGIGIGYRIFSRSHYYWGTSLSIGRYLIGDSNKFSGAVIDDLEYIYDIELLKFGYAF